MTSTPTFAPPRPSKRIVVRLPLWLKSAAAGSFGLVMVVFFEAGYSLGTRRAQASALAAVESAKLEPAASAAPKSVEVKKPEPKKVEPKKPEPVKAAPPKTEPPRKAEPKVEPKVEAKPKKLPDSVPKEIAAILRSNCILCHGDPTIKGDIDLRTFASMTKKGPALVPGDLKKSLIWLSIEEGSMPPTGKPRLGDDEIKLIRKWIEGE